MAPGHMLPPPAVHSGCRAVATGIGEEFYELEQTSSEPSSLTRPSAHGVAVTASGSVNTHGSSLSSGCSEETNMQNHVIRVPGRRRTRRLESREERRSSSGIRARRFRVGRRGPDPPAARDLQTPSCDQRTGTSAERFQPCACAVWWFTFPDEVKTHVVPALEFPARPEAVASLPRRVPPPPGSSPRPLWTCGPHGKAAQFLLAP